MILVPYWPLVGLRTLTLARRGRAGLSPPLGGAAKTDAEAGVDAWSDLLRFLNDPHKAHRGCHRTVTQFEPARLTKPESYSNF